MTTRVGDVFMLLGIAYLYTVTGTLNYREIFYNPEVLHVLGNTFTPIGISVASAIAILIFIGIVGKSAQWPLHVWLPDAMEGPTPVSAMIHAATMVSAGVYLAIRIYPLASAGGGIHHLTPAMMAMGIIGAFTAIFSATIAVAQNDIKKVLAYSTISQLGFMIAALGIGAYVAAVFHLVTHAFFKHGNHVTTPEEILTIGGVTIGAPFTATTLQEVEQRLRKSGKFDDVQVLKRYASIADATRIALVIIVNEGPVRIGFETEGDEKVAKVVRRRGFRNLMYLPILDGEDGYGLTYGLTTSLANVAGERSRLSVPLSWSGTKRAAVELEKYFAGGPLTRVEVGAAIQRRRNPAFDLDDSRKTVWARAERAIGPVRLCATAAWDRVRFTTSRRIW